MLHSVPIGRRRRLAVLSVALPALVGAGALGACGQRRVEVSTGTARDSAATLDFTNNLGQAVNVYVRAGTGSELFLRQVGARSTEIIAVRGIAPGTAVSLRAAPVDGTVSYTQQNVTLGRGVVWRVP